MSRPRPTSVRTGKPYASKPAPMPYSAAYWAWRDAVKQNKGIGAAAAAHDRYLGRRAQRA